MKLLVCTSNQPRHVTLVKMLIQAGHDVLTIVEPKSYLESENETLNEYWAHVRDAEDTLFGSAYALPGPTIALRPGELCNIVAGDRGVYAGMSQGAAHIDVEDFGARVRAAHVSRMGDAGQRKIVDKMTSPGQESPVFAALERLPDPFLPRAHFALPLSAAARTARTILT